MIPHQETRVGSSAGQKGLRGVLEDLVDNLNKVYQMIRVIKHESKNWVVDGKSHRIGLEQFVDAAVNAGIQQVVVYGYGMKTRHGQFRKRGCGPELGSSYVQQLQKLINKPNVKGFIDLGQALQQPQPGHVVWKWRSNRALGYFWSNRIRW